MGGGRHEKELNAIVYNGLCVLGSLQTERKPSSCSRLVYYKHPFTHHSHGKLLSPHGCVLRVCWAWPSHCSNAATYQDTSTSLLAHKSFNRSKSEQRDDAHSRVVLTCLWIEERAKDPNFGKHHVSNVGKVLSTLGASTAAKCRMMT